MIRKPQMIRIRDDPDPQMSNGRDPSHTAVVALGLAALAAVAFSVVFWIGGRHTQIQGALLAVAFGGIGIGLVIWANRVIGSHEHTDQRSELRAPADEEAEMEVDLDRGEMLTQRVWVRRTAIAAGAALGVALLSPFRALGPRPGKALLHTSWANGVRVVNGDGAPVRAADVPANGLLTVFPEGSAGAADAQAVLVRVDPSLLELPPGRAGWAPQGLVAYSKVCTHAGCPVGLYQTDSHQLLCPCHQSAFDVLRGAKPLSGPAAWPLPQLPLAVGADGVLRATGDFSEPVGPGWWKD